jgi:cytochrome b subunit of formate dehydrogenase
MNGLFMVSFVIIMITGLVIDRKQLQSAKTSQKICYYAITIFSLGLFISKTLHLHVPLPARFFIHTVSPWVSRIIGI